MLSIALLIEVGWVCYWQCEMA